MIWVFRARAWLWLANVLGIVSDKFHGLARHCSDRAVRIVGAQRGGF